MNGNQHVEQVQPRNVKVIEAPPVTIDTTGLATETKQDTSISFQETQISLIETLNELNTRLSVLAGMANAGAPALRTIPIASVSTPVTGTLTGVTTLGTLTNFGTGIPANILAWSQQNLLATQANINNVTA